MTDVERAELIKLNIEIERRQRDLPDLIVTHYETRVLDHDDVRRTMSERFEAADACVRYPEEEILWLVVDSSDASRESPHTSQRCGLAEARAMLNGERMPAIDSVPCPSTCAAVRLGDKGNNYDLDVARMLVQAAIEARRYFSKHGSAAADPTTMTDTNSRSVAEAQVSFMDPIAQLRSGNDWRWLGVSGIFGGGWCEAGVLTYLPELIARLGGDGDRAVLAPARVGSVAIPIQNYRQMGGMRGSGDQGPSELAFLPERTHVSALNTAFLILLSAFRLNMEYSYPQRGKLLKLGYRGWLWRDETSKRPESPDALVSAWSKRALAEAAYGNGRLVAWVEQHGKGLARAMSL